MINNNDKKILNHCYTPKIIILRGNSGSGKTTTANILQRLLGKGTMMISQDSVRREMLYVNDGPETKTVDLMMQLVKYGKANCSITIVEGILHADWYQRLFETIKNEFKGNIYAYYFDIPFKETFIRHQTKPNAADFGEAEMKKWWKEKDYINIIPEHRITEDMTQDDIVNLIKGNII